MTVRWPSLLAPSTTRWLVAGRPPTGPNIYGRDNISFTGRFTRRTAIPAGAPPRLGIAALCVGAWLLPRLPAFRGSGLFRVAVRADEGHLHRLAVVAHGDHAGGVAGPIEGVGYHHPDGLVAVVDVRVVQ